MSLTDSVKQEALRLGFSLVGVTTAEPPPHWPAYVHWLSMGRHGSMHYLSDRRRADPRLVLPECQSILVLAMRYPDPQSFVRGKGPHPVGSIAAYAWGRDYHLVLSEYMNALTSFIEKLAGRQVPHRQYTDTGPILERDLAQRAGLGWIGKNTCLIHPKMGSYFLLSEILLGIELEPDLPFSADRCGECSRCISACPTDCILPDRTLDARRCISYLTIENKSEIPIDLRPLLGERVFGCDICQQACPWNRASNQDNDPALNAPIGKLPNPDLIDEMSLSQKEYKLKFKDNPVLRSKWQGYLRNVAVALGNSKDPEALPVLQRSVQGNEPLIREHAAWAIEQIQKEQLNHE